MDCGYSGCEVLEALENAHAYNHYLSRLIREASASKDIVDFGAGSGTFARRLRDNGCRVLCVEPDSGLRQRLRDEGMTAVADIDALPDNSVSFLFALNVLEHIRDDRNALSKIYSKLKVGGCLLVYVPAFHCLWSSLDDKVCHYRRYTKGTLGRLVREEGLSIEKLQYADSLGFFAALAFRILRRSPEGLTAESIGFYDRWVFPASRLLDILLHRFFGKNVFVVCRK